MHSHWKDSCTHGYAQSVKGSGMTVALTEYCGSQRGHIDPSGEMGETQKMTPNLRWTKTIQLKKMENQHEPDEKDIK